MLTVQHDEQEREYILRLYQQCSDSSCLCHPWWWLADPPWYAPWLKGNQAGKQKYTYNILSERLWIKNLIINCAFFFWQVHKLRLIFHKTFWGVKGNLLCISCRNHLWSPHRSPAPVWKLLYTEPTVWNRSQCTWNTQLQHIKTHNHW